MQTEHCTETQKFLNVLYILFISQKVNTLSFMPLSNHCFVFTMRTNLLNWCNLVSISKNVVFYAFLVEGIYQYLADFVNIY